MLFFKLYVRVAFTALLFFFSSWVLLAQNYSLSIDDGKIVYHVDSLGNRVLDYSYCGYHHSDEDIPFVRNEIFVPHREGDASQTISRAIQYVESLPLNKNGFRGAVLLDKGEFTLDHSIAIRKSGVVLRGYGNNETILRKRGVDRSPFICVEGIEDVRYLDTLAVAAEYIPVNSRIIPLQSVSGLVKGDKIFIFRPSTTEWISALGCDHFGGGITALGWKAGDADLFWDRTIIAVNENTIEIDAPLSMALDPREADSQVYSYKWPGRIVNCGIENIQLVSDYDEKQLKDEDHCWTAISVENAQDCWVRRVVFSHFAGSAVVLQPTSSCVTVEDCISRAPISEIGGMRRNTFLTLGQLNLFQRCYSEDGIHDFAAGYCAAGPNAFVQCEAKGAKGHSGAIDIWSCGLLFDIVNIEGHNLIFKNQGQHNNGAGWGTGNSLFWQCTASEIECWSPDSINKNRAYGCWSQFSGDGEWYSSNNHLTPRSFFYDQLEERLKREVDERSRVLPLNTSATSSPTVTQAMEMTQLASVPRQTLQSWIKDSLSLSGSLEKNLLTVDKLDNKSGDARSKYLLQAQGSGILITNGRIAFGDQLLVGGKHDVPWWNGKLRRSAIQKAKPHVTRFVPGREGWGLTDRIDSVITYMTDNNLAVLDHNYGLWYDRRRDDHQRVKRADGDVWGPFYEQPFARSGIGMAWDGLSKYDLTKPNRWYWSRLVEFAEKASNNGILLYHQNYFQHNILEAGAHWVDSPWRSTNNINDTGFPEPVPFAGDKRIFMAEMFYDIDNPVRRNLHRGYIRQCLDAFADQGNVAQLISAEFTGPLHFVQFWIDEIASWEKETGKNALVALSTTKDVQDAILRDPVRSKIVDIIDIRYWHYKDGGQLYAPEGGLNMAPRQFARKMKVGKTLFEDVYNAVSEYREKYPEKVVTYYAQKYPEMAWAVFMSGGSLPSIPTIDDSDFLKDALRMDVKQTPGYYMLVSADKGAIIYFRENIDGTVRDLPSGVYRVKVVNPKNGKVVLIGDQVYIEGSYQFKQSLKQNMIYWFQRIGNFR